MRDPSAPGWPELGARTDSTTTAESWRSAYEKHWKEAATSAHERATGRYSTLRAAADAWFSHRDAQTAESTASGSRTAITHLMEYVGDKVHPASVTPKQLQSLWDDFLTQGYAAASVSNTRNHVSKFFAWLGIDPNPVRGTTVPKQPHRDIQAWSATDQAKIRAAADRLDQLHGTSSINRRRLVELLFDAGLRIQEAAAAVEESIDRRARTMRVTKQIARKSNAPKPPKDNGVRTVVLLQEWWEHYRGGCGLIVSGDDGRPIPHRKLYDYVVEVLEEAGVKKPGEAAHQFRHTYAFLFLIRGGTMEQLQKGLGHAKISTTQQYYDHFTSEHAARAGVRSIYRTRRGPRR